MGHQLIGERLYEADELGQMSPDAYVAKLRAVCGMPGRGYIDHPLVRGIEAGTISMPQLRFWAEQTYLHIRNMMPAFGTMAMKCPHIGPRTTLIKNLAEECFGAISGLKGHPEMMLDVCIAFGMDPAEVQTRRQLRPSRKVTDYYEFMANCRPWYVPVAAIGAVMEAATPDTFGRMADGLKKNYGLNDQQVLFFTMHVEADQDHGDEAIELVEHYVDTPEARLQVFDCAIENAENWYGLFDCYRMVPA